MAEATKPTKTSKSDTGAELFLEGSRLKSMEIRNYRCIGPEAVKIDLDDIVVLVGPNNAGKSTILKAYSLLMAEQKTAGQIKDEDCPGGKYDPENPTTIIVEIWLGDKKPGPEWILVDPETGKEYIRERFIWEDMKSPSRRGWDKNTKDWSDKRPWGWATKAAKARPTPFHIDAFDGPETQAKTIVSFIKKAIDEALAAKDSDNKDTEEMMNLQGRLYQLHRAKLDGLMSQRKSIADDLSRLMASVFADHEVQLGCREKSPEELVLLGTWDMELRMGPTDGYKAPLEQQGSGARRTMLWQALRLVADNDMSGGKKGTSKTPKVEEQDQARTNLLLLDEPEICLHPNAIRFAREALYDLATTNDRWQVMITTHSPQFISLERNNTTIIRVEQSGNNGIKGTTLYRAERAKLTDDEKEELKLLNVFDPYVAEFFFGGHTVIVEGDTEYSAFKYVISQNPDEFKNVHIVRARGKATIAALVKILNQFKAPYAVLHDSDLPKLRDGSANGAWTTNENILKAVVPKENSQVRLVASLENFEAAFTKKRTDKDKPYHAFLEVKSNPQVFQEVRKLLEALIDKEKALPSGAAEWNDLNELEKQVMSVSNHAS